MRILQVVQKPQRRGAEIFANQLSDKLSQLGHEVKVLYLYPFEGPNALPLRSSDLILGKDASHFSEIFPGWNPHILKAFLRKVREFCPDVVQANAARTVKYASMVHRLDSKRSWILIYRNIGDPTVWLRRFWRKWLYQHFLMTRVRGMVAVSSRSSEVLKSLYKGSHRVATIPRGIEPSAYIPVMDREAMRKKMQAPADSSVLIFVGSLTPEKRIDRLLRMIKQVNERVSDVHLWLLGNGPLRSEMEVLSLSLGIQSSVQFAGLQSDVASYLNAADLLVLSSDTEGIPGVVLEAALFGVPAVAPRVGGVPECVVDGETGILFDPSDEQDFGSAVVALIQNREKRKEMGILAKQRVKGHYTMDRIAQRYLDFYQQVLQEKRK